MTQPDPNATGQSAGAGGQSAAGAGGEPNAGNNPDPNAAGQGGQSATEPTPPAGTTVSQADFDALKRQLQAADQGRAAAEKKIQDAERLKLDETARLKLELQEAQAETEKAKLETKEQAVKLAFMADVTYEWKNPATALRVVDLSKVTIGEDGKVEGMKAALDALAKSDPYLLKDKESGEADPTPGSTGVPANNGRNAGATNRTDLEKKFPALRGRVAN